MRGHAVKNVLLVLFLAGVSLMTVRSAAAQPAGPTCSVSDQAADEGDSGTASLVFAVECDNPTAVTESIGFLTSDDTATAPDDYLSATGGLEVQPGNSHLEILVDVVGDTVPEPNETFFVSLFHPEGAVAFGRQQAAGTIRNDDGSGPNPPCIVLSDTSTNVNGASFSTPSERRVFGSDPHLTITNCGTANVNLRARGTDATGAGATWQLTDQHPPSAVDSTCELGLDLFRAGMTLWNLPNNQPGIGTEISTHDRTLKGAGPNLDEPFVLATGAEQELSPDVEMPCVGSSGAGQPMTMDIVITAVAAP